MADIKSRIGGGNVVDDRQEQTDLADRALAGATGDNPMDSKRAGTKTVLPELSKEESWIEGEKFSIGRSKMLGISKEEYKQNMMSDPSNRGFLIKVYNGIDPLDAPEEFTARLDSRREYENTKRDGANLAASMKRPPDFSKLTPTDERELYSEIGEDGVLTPSELDSYFDESYATPEEKKFLKEYSAWSQSDNSMSTGESSTVDKIFGDGTEEKTFDITMTVKEVKPEEEVDVEEVMEVVPEDVEDVKDEPQAPETDEKDFFDDDDEQYSIKL